MTTAPVSKRPRDWFRILRTLMKYGVSLHDVARATGKTAGAVKGWQEGSEPKESDARIILALLAKYAPDEYVKQQKEFDIRLDIEGTICPGEQRRLSFVEVK